MKLTNNPLILSFAEEPSQEGEPLENIEYSKDLNLTVFKDTNTPAIEAACMTTSTFTKATGESSDSDDNGALSKKNLQIFTNTNTRNTNETSDADNALKRVYRMMVTQTLTESRETTDTDR